MCVCVCVGSVWCALRKGMCPGEARQHGARTRAQTLQKGVRDVTKFTGSFNSSLLLRRKVPKYRSSVTTQKSKLRHSVELTTLLTKIFTEQNHSLRVTAEREIVALRFVPQHAQSFARRRQDPSIFRDFLCAGCHREFRSSPAV